MNACPTTACWLTPGAREAWNRFVTAHPDGTVYHLWEWQEVLERSFPHMRCRIAALCTSDGAIQAALPVCLVSSRLLGRRLVSMPFATLFDPLAPDRASLAALLALVRAFEREAGARRLEIRTWRRGDLFDAPPGMHATYRHHYLDLRAPLEQLLKSFHPDIPRRIRHAERRGVTVTRAQTLEELRTAYRLLCLSRHRLQLPLIPYAFFLNQWQILGPPGHLELLLVHHRGTPAACAFLQHFGALTALEYVGDDARYRADGVNQVLNWQAMQAACRAGSTTYSFGRTAISNVSLLRWKACWGTHSEDLNTFSAAHGGPFGPVSERETSAGYRLAHWLAGSLPRPLLAPFGRFCYRHLG